MHYFTQHCPWLCKSVRADVPHILTSHAQNPLFVGRSKSEESCLKKRTLDVLV